MWASAISTGAAACCTWLHMHVPLPRLYAEFISCSVTMQARYGALAAQKDVCEQEAAEVGRGTSFGNLGCVQHTCSSQRCDACLQGSMCIRRLLLQQPECPHSPPHCCPCRCGGRWRKMWIARWRS